MVKDSYWQISMIIFSYSSKNEDAETTNSNQKKQTKKNLFNVQKKKLLPPAVLINGYVIPFYLNKPC